MSEQLSDLEKIARSFFVSHKNAERANLFVALQQMQEIATVVQRLPQPY
jgi:hypothetical protein